MRNKSLLASLIKNEIPIYESELIDIKADNLHIHNIILKSSKPNVKPLTLKTVSYTHLRAHET